MLFRIVILSVFLVFGGSKIAHTENPPVPAQPECLIKGRPQTWHILTQLPEDKDSRNITYQAQYCHPSTTTKFCIRNELFETVCTFNKTHRIRDSFFQCDMTEVVWSLYPNLVDSRLRPKVRGNTLCTVISATNYNGTRYGKQKCCSVRIKTACTGILNLQATPSAKRELNITWETPADISDGWNKVLVYEIRYTGNSETKIITFDPFTDKLDHHSRQHSIILKGLPPYTQYSVEVSCYYISPSGNFDSQVMARTLQEAPYSPPIITGIQTMSSNNTMKSVKLKWKHPPISKRNGNISKSVVSYRNQRNNSSSSRSFPLHTYNLTIPGPKSETVIEGLDINLDYLVAVMSCTVECSVKSSEYQIKREPIGPLPSPNASTGSPLSTVTVTILVLVAVFVAVLALVLAYAILQRRKRRRNQVPRVPLPEPEDIQVSHITPDSEVSDHLESSEYAFPATLLTSVESANHERASMLQNENDGGDTKNNFLLLL
ncbi:uncharacterized protein LOC116305021 isoform X2 [Actinia tenebrosa]|uniref:Uncharacterized protein LOC116305021 isoform X2 n=1 Tax=Actinia tenebrosa TaxID=6105 RepID=A0A6P8IXS0_ACTTE|nr:uncharacterized protein LOC116305021 isoform X2 [Actinia tenebrosa]